MSKDNKKGQDSSNNKPEAKVLPFRVPEKETEATLLSNVKKILDILKMQGLLAYKRIHCMPIMRGNGRFSPNVDQAGMADLQIYLLGGITLHLELKSHSGRQSDKQKEVEMELRALGHKYYLCNSVEEFVSILRAYGLMVRCFPA